MIREILGIAEGILQDLHDDHNEVAALFERIADSDLAGERSALFREMSTKLLAHAHAEEEVFYARLASSANEDSRRFALEGKNEHAQVEGQVRQIRGIADPMSEGWVVAVNDLEELVDHHIDEEEGEGFSCARDDFTKEQLEAMGRQFQTRKQELMATLR